MASRHCLARGFHRPGSRCYTVLVSAQLQQKTQNPSIGGGDIIPPRSGTMKDYLKCRKKKKKRQPERRERSDGSPHRCIIRQKPCILVIRGRSARIPRALAGGLLRTSGGVGTRSFARSRLPRDGLAALEDLTTKIGHGGREMESGFESRYGGSPLGTSISSSRL